MAENLIQRWLQNRDEQAAEALYQAHNKRVYRLAFALLGDASTAEEVMQDTMTYALTHTESYDPERSSFSTWLHTITVSHCRDRQQGQGEPKASPARSAVDVSNAASRLAVPTGVASAREGRDELGQALDQLNPKLREAIVLRYWSGHTYQEMAEILRCPVPTAQSRVRLAYEKMRKLLDPTGVPALGGENLR